MLLLLMLPLFLLLPDCFAVAVDVAVVSVAAGNDVVAALGVAAYVNHPNLVALD